jgi:hypothetical protein
MSVYLDTLPPSTILVGDIMRSMTVLHYDADYDRIGEITGQPMQWVRPRGSL